MSSLTPRGISRAVVEAVQWNTSPRSSTIVNAALDDGPLNLDELVNFDFTRGSRGRLATYRALRGLTPASTTPESSSGSSDGEVPSSSEEDKSE